MELSRSMAAILEMPQYVAYQKNAVYAFIKLSTKSQSFNILRTMVVVAALLIRMNGVKVAYLFNTSSMRA